MPLYIYEFETIIKKTQTMEFLTENEERSEIEAKHFMRREIKKNDTGYQEYSIKIKRFLGEAELTTGDIE